jgi:hypothetical protein
MRPATWLAWLLWFATLAFGATVLLGSLEPRWSWYVLTHYFYRNPDYFSNVLTSAILVIAVPAYATVGAIVASLRPKNGVGWLCLALGPIVVVGSWQPTGTTPMGLAAALSGLAWVLMAPPLAVTLLLIYPDGRLLSHHPRTSRCGCAPTRLRSATGRASRHSPRPARGRLRGRPATRPYSARP